MDEDLYRTTYNKLNPNRCIFEKSITNRRCDCELKRRFLIASREGVACRSEDALYRCTQALDSIRNNARFSLKVVTVNGPMPHNKELQVQAGGLLALQHIVENDTPDSISQLDFVSNVHQTLEKTLHRFGSIEMLPYGEIVKSIVKYQSRPKRKKR